MFVARRFASLRCCFGGVALAALTLGACALPADQTEVDHGEDLESEDIGKTSSAYGISVFSINLYESALVSALENTNGMGGYSYAILKDGWLLRSGAAGLARRQPQIPWTEDVPFSMMGLSTTITAAMYVQLIAERTDISLASPVKPYLPKGWSVDPHFDSVTFRQLLSHTSGLTTNADSWEGVEKQVATNVLAPNSAMVVNGTVVPAGVGTFFYSNTNYALGRAMMGVIDGDAAGAAYAAALGQSDEYAAMVYRGNVHDRLFAPIGLDSAKVEAAPIGDYPAGFYSANGASSYFEPTNYSTLLLAGAGYWNLSVLSYGKFLDALVNGKYNLKTSGGETLDIWKAMTTMVNASNSSNVGLGLVRKQTDRGNHYTQDGMWTNGSAGACARWMVYPNGLSAVWVMNSVVKDADGVVSCPVKGSTDMMINAYDKAWTAPLASPR